MARENILYLIICVIAALATAGLAIYAFNRQSSSLGRSFGWLMVATSAWGWVSTLVLLSSSPDLRTFWVQAGFLPVAAIPLAWLAFVFSYTNRLDWLAPRRFLFLAIIPAISLVLAWTNSYHLLIWRQLTPTIEDGLGLVKAQFGDWFWVFSAYTLLCYIAGMSLVAIAVVRSQRIYRQQAAAILITATLPVITSVLYLAHSLPTALDFTPLGFTIAGMGFAWALFRYRLFDLQPVGRASQVDSLQDAMLVVDLKGRIIDLNPAAQALLGISGAAATGLTVEELPSPWPQMVHAYQDFFELQTELITEVNGEQRYYEMRILPLNGKGGKVTGRMILLRDISERRRAEIAEHQRLQELTALYTLSQAINESNRVDTLVERAVHVMGSIFGAEVMGVGLLTGQNEQLNFSFSHLDGVIQQVSFPLADSGYSAMAGDIVLRLADISRQQNFTPLDPQSRSALAAPVRTAARTVGLIMAESVQPNFFTATDEHLMNTIASQLGIAFERLRLFEEVQQMAQTDFVTGLYNRWYFFELAEREFKRARRYKTPLSLIMADLDFFKQVNDIYGHLAGDSTLQVISERFQKHVREVDIVGRYGGDEFIILLPQCEQEVAVKVAGRLNSAAHLTIGEDSDQPVVVTISQGVAGMCESCTSLEMLIHLADQALYEAKNNGRNQIGVAKAK